LDGADNLICAPELILIGKFLETLGTLLLAWVGVRAMYIAVWIEGPVRSDPPDEELIDIESQDVSDVQKLLKEIQRRNEIRHKLFGYYEAIYVGIGTILVAIGCVIYLIGILIAET
jgi:hypothetical protein